eukprot:CAMPEP_0114541652 /NCGR_PEP_ID=MMETSP0114-20121206/1417_1 /TAXON_ID=31324 /ORGANISM="Goniomonas sp, Strain m" /LENGTH=162 /DNA_ID=CAMNT_0001725899 /DNA_START=193 /DNA_END=681 /DNA_ORIENTATION=-
MILTRSSVLAFMGLSFLLLAVATTAIRWRISQLVMQQGLLDPGPNAQNGGGGGLAGRLDPLHLQLTLMNRDFNANDYEALLALDASVETSLGATQGEIDRLPQYVYDGGGGKRVHTCSICLEQLEIGQGVRILPCMHQFHDGCVDHWLQMQATCPVCKITVV